ncbi:MAG: PQQ-binding-like beta-propeller repeat protein [Bacteroidetes bacterium]|jgi:outer membrane protein assembly factor BamB|nr:PQQ-binding-like beta-propeller repeat protein [Bacteroidota bacterium]
MSLFSHHLSPQSLIGCGLLLVALLSCQNNAKEQVYWSVPYAEEYAFYPVAWKQLLVLPSYCEGEPCLQAVNQRDGKEAWRLRHPALRSLFYNSTPYLVGEQLVFAAGQHLLAIAASSGELLWQHTHLRSGDPYLFGDSQHVYRSYPAATNKGFEVYQFALDNGQAEHIQTIPVRNSTSSLARSPVCVDQPGSSLLVSSVVDYLPQGGTESYLLSWRKEQPLEQHKHEVYPNNSKGYGATLPPLYVNNHLYGMAYNEVFGYDPFRKTEIWRTALPRELLTSRLSWHDGYLYAATEDAVLYVLDAVHGEKKWEVDIAGTPSRIFHTKDGIFLIGGSDRLLYQVSRDKQQVIAIYQNQEATGFERVAYISKDIAVLSDGKRWHGIPLGSLADSLVLRSSSAKSNFREKDIDHFSTD